MSLAFRGTGASSFFFTASLAAGWEGGACGNMTRVNDKVTWCVEGSNWTWRKEMGGNCEADEVATQAVEDIARWGRGDGPLLGELEIRGEDMPKVGLIMMVSTSAMRSVEEHLVVLSSSVMANAGMHRAARILKDGES